MSCLIFSEKYIFVLKKNVKMSSAVDVISALRFNSYTTIGKNKRLLQTA